MSTLANFLESEGVATALVSLVDAQSAPANPPRVLWVPFELGRPLGEPQDAEFQTEVLQALLALFDEPVGPVRREFGRDAPSATESAEWTPPDLSGAKSIVEELQALAPHHAEFMANVGRTTAALAGLDINECGRFVSGFDAGYRPAGESTFSAILWFRFAADDLKAHYFEAATRGHAVGASVQLQRWLWNETQLGNTLRRFWHDSVDSDDNRRAIVGGRFIVPNDWRVAPDH